MVKGGFGSSLKRAASEAPEDAQMPKKPVMNSSTIMLKDIDVSLLDFSPIKQGNWDRNCWINYNGGKFNIKLASIINDGYSMLANGLSSYGEHKGEPDPFEKHNILVKLTPEQDEKLMAMQEKFQQHLLANREEFEDAVKKKKKLSSEEVLLGEKYNKLTVELQDGTKALRIGVQHRPDAKDGSSRRMPKIEKTNLISTDPGNLQMEKPVAATVQDLKKGTACTIIFNFGRGIYSGASHGVRPELSSAQIYLNRSLEEAPRVEHEEEVQYVDSTVDKEASKTSGADQDNAFLHDDGMGGYDDGTGGQ